MYFYLFLLFCNLSLKHWQQYPVDYCKNSSTMRNFLSLSWLCSKKLNMHVHVYIHIYKLICTGDWGSLWEVSWFWEDWRASVTVDLLFWVFCFIRIFPLRLELGSAFQVIPFLKPVLALLSSYCPFSSFFFFDDCCVFVCLPVEFLSSHIMCICTFYSFKHF